MKKKMIKEIRNLPRYKKCFICGKENPYGLHTTFKTDGERVFATVKFKEHHIGFENRVHGGIISGILDEAMGWACTVKTKRMYFTIELKVRFKRAVEPSKDYMVVAFHTGEKHGICSAKGELKEKNGRVLAVAEGSYYPLDIDYQKKVLTQLHHEPEDDLPVEEKDL